MRSGKLKNVNVRLAERLGEEMAERVENGWVPGRRIEERAQRRNVEETMSDIDDGKDTKNGRVPLRKTIRRANQAADEED